MSITFIHRANRRSLQARVAFSRLGIGAAIFCLAVFGSALTPLVGLVALAMVGLTAFEVWHSRIPGRAVEPTTVPHQREQREH